MILDRAGNAIASYGDEIAARAALHAIVRIEPETADELTILAYDDDGMPVGDARTVFDTPPGVTIEGAQTLLQKEFGSSFVCLGSVKRNVVSAAMPAWSFQTELSTISGDLT